MKFLKGKASNIVMTILFLTLVSCSGDHKHYIAVIGDQNSTEDKSWVYQLRDKLPGDKILNFSYPGNTFGFNNLDNKKLNTLRNIEIYLDNALDSIGGRRIDYLIVSLGTNDCKSIFDKELSLVPNHLRELIRKINSFPGFKNRPPRIIVLSPLPFGPDSTLPSRYKGADERVKYLVPYFKDIAHQNRCGYIDVYNPLQPEYSKYSSDGIHLNHEGHKMLAAMIYEYIADNS